ncbi:MAG TPA: phage baseplate assembly protein V, partial [Kofleriaceae bacterium]|nr:phage baseplate assembly protein V [Kofleriaceae bacterium]
MDADTTAHIMELLRSRYVGKYRGTVVDNADSTGRGRLKVKVPAVLGELALWAMPCVPYAGQKVGLYCLPEPETGVWVEFEAGDPSFPIWVGCFWADDEIPDDNDAAIKVWRTEKATIRLDDNDQAMLLSTDAGAEIELTDEVRAEAGGGKLVTGQNAVTSSGGS